VLKRLSWGLNLTVAAVINGIVFGVGHAAEEHNIVDTLSGVGQSSAHFILDAAKLRRRSALDSYFGAFAT
jgi:hypothetical protein